MTNCRNDQPLLDQAADDTQGVVDGALGLLDHQLVGAADHNAHRLPRAGAACDLHGATVEGISGDGTSRCVSYVLSQLEHQN